MPAPPASFYRRSESLAQKIQDLANEFANMASVLSQQYANLNKATNGLLDGTFPWKGKGADKFFETWQEFGTYIQQVQKSCEDTHATLIKLFGRIDDAETQQCWDILLTIAGGIITIMSLAAAIAEGGLNPFVDGFFGWAGSFTEQEGSSVLNVSEEITQADTTAAMELQTIEDELTTSPALTGSSNALTVTPGGISPTNLDEMTTGDINLSDGDLASSGDDGSTLYTKNNSNVFKNPINMENESTEANMPLGVNSDTGKYWIQQIKNLGVRVEWNRSVQVDLESARALGFTANNNFDPQNGDPAYIVVGLSPDATDGTVYEEYLHVQAAEVRGWMRPLDGLQGNLTEEIQVEYKVLQDINMSDAEFNQLSQGRQGYIAQLKDLYMQKGLPWPPANLVPYLQDPPKP